jgi:ubiquitin-activating enzyme E1 C
VSTPDISACQRLPADCRCRQVKKPSLSHGGKPLYLQAPPQLEQATRPNLEKKLSELGVEHDSEIVVTASSLPFNLTLRIKFNT